MKGTLLAFMISMFGSGFTNCHDKSEPTAPPEILNITGHWVYNATFTRNDSIWHIDPTGAANPNLKITSSGNSLAGIGDRSIMRFCRGFNCSSPTVVLGGGVRGSLTSDNQITFFITDIALGEIKHDGLVNVIRTDLPSGNFLRMSMNGTAEMILPSVGRVTGFFNAERVLYDQE